MGSYNPSRSVQTTLSASFVSGSTGILQNLTVPEYVSASIFYGSASGLKDLPAGAGSGDVSKAGSPVDDQVAVWTDGSTIQGEAKLRFNDDTLKVTGSIIASVGISGSSVSGSHAIFENVEVLGITGPEATFTTVTAMSELSGSGVSGSHAVFEAVNVQNSIEVGAAAGIVSANTLSGSSVSGSHAIFEAINVQDSIEVGAAAGLVSANTLSGSSVSGSHAVFEAINVQDSIEVGAAAGGVFANTLSGSNVSASLGLFQQIIAVEQISASAFIGSGAGLTDLPSAGGGSTPPVYWDSTTDGKLFTSGSVIFRGGLSLDDPNDIGSDVFFHVSGTNNMSGYLGMTGFETTQARLSLGGDVYVSGAILGTRDAGTSNTILGIKAASIQLGESAEGALGYAGDDAGVHVSGTIGGKYLGVGGSLDGVFTVMGDSVTSGSAYYGNMDNYGTNPGTDINFFVSGTVNGKSAGTARTVAVFGGDLILSGGIVAHPAPGNDTVTQNSQGYFFVATPRANYPILQSEGFEVANICHGTGSIPHGLESKGGGLAHKKRVFNVETPLDLSSVTAAKQYSGCIFGVTMNNSFAFAVTLPTATSAEEGKQLTGWHATFIIQEDGNENVTIIRGDGTNDAIFGTVVAGDAASSGITVGSNVVTFVGGTVAMGDRVDVVCISADASNTFYAVTGMCQT